MAQEADAKKKNDAELLEREEKELKETVEKIIAANPQAVADFKGGKEKALGSLVGQTMRAMKGKANPGMVNQMLRDLLK